MVYTVDEARVRNPPRVRLLRYYTSIQGVPKKWCTFENAVIRSGKQVEKCLKDPQFLQLSTTFMCQFTAKISTFVKNWPKKKSLNFLKYTIAGIFDVFLSKNSIIGAKNSLKCEFTLFLPLLILMKTIKSKFGQNFYILDYFWDLKSNF